MRSAFLDALGGEDGCEQLSAAFYARVGKDVVLRPLFPGKSLRCATEEFAAFLIAMLGGDADRTQARWWLSVRESHARFRIDAAQRSAWLRHMQATLDAAALDGEKRDALRQMFLQTSAYVIGKGPADVRDVELSARWTEQRLLDEAVAAIHEGDVDKAIAGVDHFASRTSIFVGLLARLLRRHDDALTLFAIGEIEKTPSLVTSRFAGKTLLHFASGAGSLPVVRVLLQSGGDPNIQDKGGHGPLYCVANECASEDGPAIVRVLVRAGADANARGGVTQATPLHMAARRGFVGIARALLDLGADPGIADRKCDTPLRRALNCKKFDVARLLAERA